MHISHNDMAIKTLKCDIRFLVAAGARYMLRDGGGLARKDMRAEELRTELR
jgi:hypothetical protein